MHPPGQHEDERETTLLSTPAGEDEGLSLDEGERVDGVVEFNQRRAKMERLRAEGINPYPHGSWLKDRTLIKDVLAAHDPSELEAGEHPELRYHVAGRLISRRGHPGPRRGRVPARPLAARATRPLRRRTRLDANTAVDFVT